jgi:hypothetical protein
VGHEDLDRAHQVAGSSDRAFGLVLAGALLLYAVSPFLRHAPPRWWALALAVALALVALAWPHLLAGANRVWTRLGLILGAIVSPAALALLFFGVLAPLGSLMRLTRNDTLRRGQDADAKSYWIVRESPGPPTDSMERQF